jgi:RHS repeat-associated protein
MTTSASTDSTAIAVALKPAAINTTLHYAYADSSDNQVATLDTSNNVVERTIALAGGVLVSKRAAGTDVWSYPNLHGDVTATSDPTGTKTGSTYTYDPYGNPLGGFSDNQVTDKDAGWLGGKQRALEHSSGLLPVIEMGDRQYAPLLGRFLQIDPVVGGNENGYVYPTDPINQSDLDGRSSTGNRRKQLEKVIQGYLRQVAAHEAKIRAEEAKGRDANRGRIRHWEGEIRGFKKTIEQKSRTLALISTPSSNWDALKAAGGLFAVGGLAWWGAKVLSPACGPLWPVCAVGL